MLDKLALEVFNIYFYNKLIKVGRIEGRKERKKETKLKKPC